MKKRFTEEQIVGILREHEAGRTADEICRQNGICMATLFRWKARYGGMDVSEARKLKGLLEQNGKLKRLLADAMLDNAALKDLLSKNF
jgi:putative transposase